MENKLFTEKTPALNLWIYFKIYGLHEAGIEICNRANDGDETAEIFKVKIWNKEF